MVTTLNGFLILLHLKSKYTILQDQELTNFAGKL